MTSTVHIRFSILNPGAEVTALKFRGWLRREAADIDQQTQAARQDHQASVIRIYLTEKLRLAIGQRKLDTIFQDVVDRFDSIYRVEFRIVDAPLDTEQMMLAQNECKVDIEALIAAAGTESPNDPTIH